MVNCNGLPHAFSTVETRINNLNYKNIEADI